MINNLVFKLYDLFDKRDTMPKINRPLFDRKRMIEIKDDVIKLSQELKDKHPHFSSELFTLKDSLFLGNYVAYAQLVGYSFNPECFIAVFTILKALKYEIENESTFDFWAYTHPIVKKVSQKLYNDTHYSKAVLTAFVEINARVKKIRKQIDGKELDGTSLMKGTFSANLPVLPFEDNSTENGKNVQQGYMDIFAGVMSCIRNPSAHENMETSEDDAIRKLMLASLLMYKIDEALTYSKILEHE